MGRLWNQYIRWVMKKLSSTGLEQELNQKEIIGELVFPEIAAVARQMAAEGIVLLKNERNTLPLSVNDTVAVFGRCAVDYFTVGYGSGGDVVAPYRKNLMEGLRENGVRLYEPLAQRYSKWCSSPKNEPDEGFWGNWPMNYPEMPLKEKTVAEASENSDAALVIIGRAAGEDRENLLKKGSFYLTDRERSMLELVTAHFNRVAVIMDCGNVIDMSWTESYGDKIGAILYAWQGGMESGTALADILTGKESPSGALTDCIARNYADYPSSSSFGGKEYNAYTEDIYVGYRYFESFAKDKVLYPFGYGLSYTTFEAQSEAKQADDTIIVNVRVTNTGNLRGKRIVQVYLGLPCGKLGNPVKVLAGFAKTRTLEPGESQTVTIEIDLREFASYDDSGISGYKSCFVLEQGDYHIEVGSNVRDTSYNYADWGSNQHPAPGTPRNALGWVIDERCMYWNVRFVYERYKLPIMITENGLAAHDMVSLDGKVHDPKRADFIKRYLGQLKRAANEGIPLLGYQHWSVMDNFEWAEGYDPRFGLVYVDFTTGKRIIKDSAWDYKHIIETNGAEL